MSSADARETYLPDHRWLDDAVLLALPAQGPFTRLTLFVCTYVARLGNLHIDFVELTRIMCGNPHGCLLAINSNFGHAAQSGHEGHLKAPKPAPVRRVPTRGRPRKVQGDGTCFNSAVEPVVAVEHPGIADDKVYFVKCFPTTGETQVPGVVCPDLSDGHAVLEAYVAYLNELGVGDAEERAEAEAEAEPESDPGGDSGAADAGPARRKPIVILSEQPKMLNYKFRVIRNSPRILVNLINLAAYLHNLEVTKASEENPLSELQASRFHDWPAVLLPPFPVRETKPPTDDVKVSFRFDGGDRAPRINIFLGGKINILGADSVEAAEKIYDYFQRLFTVNWEKLVCLQPRRDLERSQPPRPRAPAPAPPPPALSDAEVDDVLGEIYGEIGAGEPESLPKSGGSPATVSEAVVDDIVADLDDWDVDDWDLDELDDPGASDDPVLGEVERDRVEEDEKYAL